MNTDRAMHQDDAAADRIRAGLLLTLRELDRRRQRLTALPRRLLCDRDLWMRVGGGVLVMAGVLFGVGFLRQRRRMRALPRERIRGALRAWMYPERIATMSGPRPVVAGLGAKLLVVFAGALAQQVAVRAARNVLPRPS